MSLSARAQKLMDDEERARIVRQATEDTEKFLASLPKNGYKDGWSEDKWEEEMEQHPLFMSGISDDQSIPPLAEAFQKLKYDPEYNDPAELAKAYKEDGNVYFKENKYKYAVMAYSEGLKVNCEVVELNVQLYSNRAAAFYHMGSYKAAFEDAIAAKALKQGHIKALRRGALCCLAMKKYDDCISWCEEGLKLNKEDKELLDVKQKAIKEIEKLKQLNQEAEAECALVDGLTRAIKDRGIKIDKDSLTPKSIVYDYNGASAKVHMTDNGEIVWPVVLLYPQYRTSDFIPNFNENSCFYDYFCELFKDQPDWDVKKEYTPDNLKVYFCDKKGDVIPVNKKKSLKSAMCHKRFQVISGSLNFYITSSEYDEAFRSLNFSTDS